MQKKVQVQKSYGRILSWIPPTITSESEPATYYARETLDHFIPKKNLVYQAHMQQVDKAAKVGLPTFPPSIVSIYDQVMTNLDTLVFA